MPNYTVSIYLGSNADGEKLLKLIEAHCTKEGLSVSEYIKSLILKDLK